MRPEREPRTGEGTRPSPAVRDRDDDLSVLFGMSTALFASMAGPAHVLEAANPAFFTAIGGGQRERTGVPLGDLMPELEPDELHYVQQLLGDMPYAEMQQFANIYRARRKKPQEVLILVIVGFFLIAGLQRFYLGQIGMGLLYFFTGGLCFIGTILDLINYKRLTFEFNVKEAQTVKAMLRY